MKRNAVGWFEIYVDDMVRARAFYEAVFGVRLERIAAADEDGDGLDYWVFPSTPDAAGAGGGLVRMPGFKAGANSTIVYFGCADCAVEAGRAADAGGKIFKPKFSIGDKGFIALVHDTEGNLVGLHSMA